MDVKSVSEVRVTFRKVVSDRVYGGGPSRSASDTVRAAMAACPRQALHAESIRFAHPTTGAPMAISAPVPADIRALLEGLGSAGIA